MRPACGSPPCRSPCHLLVDPRLRRPRRGRPDPSARRAARRHCAPCPGLRVIRPADANETAHAWRVAVDGDGPTALVLSRQSVPVLEGTAEAAEGVARGGYVLVRRRAEAPARRHPRRDGLEVPCASKRGPPPGTGCGPGGVAAVVGALRAQQDRAIVPSTVPPASRVSPSRRPPPSAGTATPTTWFPSTTSGRRPPAPWCWKHFGYTPENVVARARALLVRTGPGPVADANGQPVRARWAGRAATREHHDDTARPLREQGQSPWLDNLRRDYLRGGGLASPWAKASAE